MNEILEELVTKVNHSLTFLDVKKKGGLKRLITINHVQFENALTLISLGELIVLLKDKCNLSIEYNYCSRVLNQERKNQGHQSTKKQFTETKGNISVTEKKSSTTTIEKGDNSSIDFSRFTNLNKLSKKLITEHDLTLEDLNEIGIKGIADDMTVYEKINRFCETKVSQAKRKKYEHLLKKD